MQRVEARPLRANNNTFPGKVRAMSRLKKSSGKEYQRLSQTADSDDEVILYSLSPSSAAAFHPTSPAATTEFGSGHYDRDLDLELPTPPPTSGRLLQVSPSKRRRGGGTAGTKVRTSRWRRRSSREARACCGFLLLGAVAVAVILLASSKLSLSNWTHHSQQASSSSSITATEAPSTPTPAATTNRLRASSTHHLSPHLSPHLSTHLSTHPHHLPPTPAPIPPAEPSTTPSSHTSQGDETTSAVVSMSLANSSEETAASTATPSGSPSQSPSPPSPSDTQQEGGGGGEGEGSGSTPSQSPSPPTTSDTQQEGEGGGGGEGEGSGSTPSQSPSPPTTSDTQQEGEGGGGGEGEGSGSTSSQSSATPSPPTTSDTQQEGGGGGISWKREFFPALTETALQLQDMNGDGVRDVVMVEGRGECDSVIHALDGLTGETVWQAHVTYDAFAVKCDVDLNKDDIIDCIAAGRQSGFRALSGSDGTTIWDRDPNLPYLRYNFYYPLFVADMDGDGVQDIVNAHGGDTTYTERNVERSPGFMVVLSGRTGEQLMERVPVPDGHETYMSPILLTRGGGDERDMILVGTGGETLPGSLWAISHDSLHRRVIRYMSTRTSKDYTLFTGYVNHPCDKRDMSVEQLEALRPVFDPRSFNTSHDAHEDMYLTSCPPWGSHQPVWNEFGLCVYQLVSCWEKGVILPPVVVDMTGDMQDDLVVSAFEGRTLVIDGESGEIVWEVDNPGTESYRYSLSLSSLPLTHTHTLSHPSHSFTLSLSQCTVFQLLCISTLMQLLICLSASTMESGTHTTTPPSPFWTARMAIYYGVSIPRRLEWYQVFPWPQAIPEEMQLCLSPWELWTRRKPLSLRRYWREWGGDVKTAIKW